MITKHKPNSNYLNCYNHASNGPKQPVNKAGFVILAIVIIVIVGAALVGA